MNVPEKKAANGTEKAYLYLWTVPAVVQGDWRMNWDSGDGKAQVIVLAFNQRYQVINASAANRDGEMKIANATIKGDDIDFFLTEKLILLNVRKPYDPHHFFARLERYPDHGAEHFAGRVRQPP